MTTPNDLGIPVDHLGRYEVLGIIGRGAFADVARGWDEALASHVAIKVLHEDASRDPFLRDRFVAEGRLLRRVHSDHVLGVHDVGELSDGRPYLIVDLADGGTLAARLERHGSTPCDTASAERITSALASGIAALHGVGVIHRDIKPDNLLITSIGSDAAGGSSSSTVIRDGLLASSERLMIGDLGLAKDLEQRGSAPSVIGGTAGYQAPEQLDRNCEVGPPTDLYAAERGAVASRCRHRRP